MAEQAIAPTTAPAPPSEDRVDATESEAVRAASSPSGIVAAPRSVRSGFPRWVAYGAAAVVVLYVLVFVRGLAWQWRGILTATNASVPVVDEGPRGAAAPPAAQVGAPAAPAAPAAAQPGRKVPLPPTEEPPPRNATDKYGVTYDDHGVAVIGIDTDPGGVYNVPPGRQVRIGGPQGDLYDVTADGKLVRAAAVRDFPR